MTKTIRRTFILVLLVFSVFSLLFQTAHAQTGDPLVLVMTADGPIMPPMLEYIKPRRRIRGATQCGSTDYST